MDEQFIQAHAQCMAHPKKPAGKPLSDKSVVKRRLVSFFIGAWAKPVPLRCLRDLLPASAPAEGHAMTLIRMGGTTFIHTL